MSANPCSPTESLNARAVRDGWPTICDDRVVFVSTTLNELAVVWHAARGDKLLPMRSDINARAIGRHLGEIAFVERVQEQGSPRRFRFGFYGSGLGRYTGDFTRKFLDEIIPDGFLANWNACFDTALELAVPL